MARTFGVARFFQSRPSLHRSVLQLQLESLEDRVMLSSFQAVSLQDANGDFLRATPPAVDVNVSQLSSSQGETHIAINPTNPQNLVIMANGGTSSPDAQFIANTFDGGQNWTIRPLSFTQDGIGGAGSDRFDAAVTFDAFGNMHAMYMARNGTSAMIYAFSSDGGSTFSTQVLEALSSSNDKPWIATGPDANTPGNEVVLVTYRNSSGLVAKAGSVSGLGAIPTFSGATTFSTDGNYAVPAVGPNGEFAITWQNPGGGQSNGNVLFDQDLDGLVGGLSFGVDATITTTQAGGFDFIPATPDRSAFSSPYVAYDRSGGAFNGRLYVAYADEIPDESDNFDIFVRFSDDNGSTWSAPTRVNDDVGVNSQFFQNISVDQATGAVVLGWYDARNDFGGFVGTDSDDIANNDVQYFAAVSTDGGASFGANVLMSDGASNQARDLLDFGNDFGDYTGIAVYDGVVHSVWVDNSNSTGDNPSGNAQFDVYTDRFTFDVTLTEFIGTDGDDIFVFDASGPDYLVTVNGTLYTLDPNSVSEVNFDGLAGNDKITYIGGADDETATLNPGSLTVSKGAFDLSAISVETIVVSGGTGIDKAFFKDSAGDDRFVSSPTKSTMSGNGFSNEANGFDSVKASATTGNDTALFSDSAGNDSFVATPTKSTMTGLAFSNEAKGFDLVIANASLGIDSAQFTGSNGNDRFTGKQTSASMSGSGFAYLVSKFDKVVASASGGTDLAVLYDSRGNDRFFGNSKSSRLVGSGFYNQANGFEKVKAIASKGTDKARLTDSAGKDTYIGKENKSQLFGKGYKIAVSKFDKIYVKAVSGGKDKAKLYGSKGNDSFFANPAKAKMSGKTFLYDVKGFDAVYAYAGAGKKDVAVLNGSSKSDKFLGRGRKGTLSGVGFLLFTDQFDSIKASGKGGKDVLDARKVKYNFSPTGFEKIIANT
jgi:hypothetical protein